jgi:putative Mg2+ transporter-C (MgtC) family protein
VSGDWRNNGGTFNHSSEVEFDGGDGQKISGSAFCNVTFGGTGTKYLGGIINVSGWLKIDSLATFDVGPEDDDAYYNITVGSHWYNNIMSPDVNWIGAIVKLVLSLLLGATIGMERRRKGQIAGLRTFALISMGATLAMLISIYIPQEYMGLKNGDPGRIAAQVVSGVGFLGAGAIIQMKGSVRGLTTAAGIWMTACIGLAVGAGMYLISIITTLLIIFILVNIERIEQRHNFLWESKIIRVKMHGILDDIQPLRDTINSNDIHISDEFMKFDYENEFTIVNFMVRSNTHVNVPSLFKEIKRLGDPISITITNEMNM